MTTPDIHHLYRDLPCIRCGYSLIGHDESGRCPECGLKAYWSLRPPQNLSQYPADWVAHMAKATLLLAAVYGGMFLLLVAGSLQFHPAMDERLITFVLLLGAVLQWIGAAMLSSWSGHWSEPRSPINRWTLRIAPAGVVIAAGVSVALMVHYDPRLGLLGAAGLILGAATPVAIFIRLRTVARLIADAGLAEHSAIVGWGFFGTELFIVLMLIADKYRWLTPGPGVGMILVLAMGVGTLLFLLWGALIFVACVIDFGRAAKVAQAEWKASGPGDQ